MNNLKSKPVLDFKSNKYQLKEINIGSLLDIEIMKAELTGGRYGTIVSHGTVISNWNLDNVDMFSALMVLCPDLMSDIKVEGWRLLSIVEIEELRGEYKLKFVPWFEEQLSFLSPKTEKKIDRKTE